MAIHPRLYDLVGTVGDAAVDEAITSIVGRPASGVATEPTIVRPEGCTCSDGHLRYEVAEGYPHGSFCPLATLDDLDVARLFDFDEEDMLDADDDGGETGNYIVDFERETRVNSRLIDTIRRKAAIARDRGDRLATLVTYWGWLVVR